LELIVLNEAQLDDVVARISQFRETFYLPSRIKFQSVESDDRFGAKTENIASTDHPMESKLATADPDPRQAWPLVRRHVENLTHFYLVTALIFELLFVVNEVYWISDYKFLKVDYLRGNAVAMCDLASDDVDLDEDFSIYALRNSHDEYIRCCGVEYCR